MAGCGSKKMAKGGMVKKSKGGMKISPRKAMAMGKKPSGGKAKVKKFAAGGMVGGAPIPPGAALPNRNYSVNEANKDFRLPPKKPIGFIPRNVRPGVTLGPRTGGPLPLPNEQNLSFVQPDSRRPVGVRGRIMFSKGGAVNKGK